MTREEANERIASAITNYLDGSLSRTGVNATVEYVLDNVEALKLDPKDQSAVEAESQLMLTIRHLQSMVLIAYWEDKRKCGLKYFSCSDFCKNCEDYHFCTQDDLVSDLINKMESGGTV